MKIRWVKSGGPPHRGTHHVLMSGDTTLAIVQPDGDKWFWYTMDRGSKPLVNTAGSPTDLDTCKIAAEAHFS